MTDKKTAAITDITAIMERRKRDMAAERRARERLPKRYLDQLDAVDDDLTAYEELKLAAFTAYPQLYFIAEMLENTPPGRAFAVHAISAKGISIILGGLSQSLEWAATRERASAGFATGDAVSRHPPELRELLESVNNDLAVCEELKLAASTAYPQLHAIAEMMAETPPGEAFTINANSAEGLSGILHGLAQSLERAATRDRTSTGFAAGSTGQWATPFGGV